MNGEAILSPRSAWKTYYHVTHVDDLPYIRRFGLNPALARGRRRAVWLCDFEMIPWTVSHVCESHGWRRDESRLIRVCMPRHEISCHRRGIFYTSLRISTEFLGFCVGT